MNTIVVHCNAMLPLQNDENSFELTTPCDAHAPKKYQIIIKENNLESQRAVDALCSTKEKVVIDIDQIDVVQTFKLEHVQAFTYKSCCLCSDGDLKTYMTCSCVAGRILLTQKTTGHQSLKTLDECDDEKEFYFGGIVQNWYATAWSSASFIVALHGKCRILAKNDETTPTMATKTVTFSDNVKLCAKKYAREEPCCSSMLCGNSILQNCWHVRLGKQDT